MDLLISVSSLGHLKYIENESLSQILYIYIYREREREKESFVRTRKKFRLHITLFTKYIALYNN